MSTGRHAKKRAAQSQDQLAKKQEALLSKDEAKKGSLEKETESQRIATMRARFGGQSPDSEAGVSGVPGVDGQAADKSRMPSKLQNRDNSVDTFMGMNLDEAGGSTQGIDKKIKKGISQ